VDGVVNVAHRIARTTQGYAKPVQAQAALLPYSLDATVAVYFNPAKPPDAVLAPKAPGAGFLLWAGIVTLAIVVAAAVRALRPPVKSRVSVHGHRLAKIVS
jgi:hypothetical protein